MRLLLQRIGRIVMAAVLLLVSCSYFEEEENPPADFLYGALIFGKLWLDSQVTPCELNPARTNVVDTGVLWSSADIGSLLLVAPNGSMSALIRTEGSGPFTIQMQTNPGISGSVGAYDRGRRFSTASGEDPMLTNLQSPTSFLCLAAGTTAPNEHFQIQIN